MPPPLPAGAIPLPPGAEPLPANFDQPIKRKTNSDVLWESGTPAEQEVHMSTPFVGPMGVPILSRATARMIGSGMVRAAVGKAVGKGVETAAKLADLSEPLANAAGQVAEVGTMFSPIPVGRVAKAAAKFVTPQSTINRARWAWESTAPSEGTTPNPKQPTRAEQINKTISWKPESIPTPAAAPEPQRGLIGPKDIDAELSARRAPVAPAPEVPTGPSASLLDDIAKGQSGKPFAKLDPNSQKVVMDLATKIHAQSLPAPAPTSSPVTPEPVTVVPAGGTIAKDPRTGRNVIMDEQGIPTQFVDVQGENPAAVSGASLPAPNPTGGIKIQHSTPDTKGRISGRANALEVHANNKELHIVDELVAGKNPVLKDSFASLPLEKQVDLVNTTIRKVNSLKGADPRFRNSSKSYGSRGFTGEYSLEPGEKGNTEAAMRSILSRLPKTPEKYVSPYGITPPTPETTPSLGEQPYQSNWRGKISKFKKDGMKL